MKLRYFASVRECLGKSEEVLALDPALKTVADLVEYLKQSGEEYAQAFASSSLRIAVDQCHAQLATSIEGVKEIAFFPPMTGG